MLFLDVVSIFKILVESAKHHLRFIYQLQLLLVSYLGDQGSADIFLEIEHCNKNVLS